MRPLAIAATAARGHGNDGESPGNDCHMTTGRGVLYQFFSWPLPFSHYWLLAGAPSSEGSRNRPRWLTSNARSPLRGRSGGIPAGRAARSPRPRCPRSPPAHRGSRVGKWPVNCRHEPEGGRYRDRRLTDSPFVWRGDSEARARLLYLRECGGSRGQFLRSQREFSAPVDLAPRTANREAGHGWAGTSAGRDK
jgi:hypothetical protein